MTTFHRAELEALAAVRGESFVSLYLPVERTGSSVEPTRIRLKNLASEAEAALAADGWRPTVAHDRLAPVRALLDDHAFWQEASQGLALFLDGGTLRTYHLPATVPVSVHVGPHLHLVPLLGHVFLEDTWQILALSHQHARLYEATRESIRELRVANMPTTLTSAVGHDVEQKSMSMRTVAAGHGAGGHVRGLAHAHGTPREEQKVELGVFLQQVDRAISATVGAAPVPLVLAGVDYVTTLYRQASVHPHLLATSLTGNPDHCTPHELHERSWPIVASRLETEERRAVERFAEAVALGRGSADLGTVLGAAEDGRISLLLVTTGAPLWGRWEPAARRLALHGARQPGDADLVDLAVIGALQTDARIVVLPADRMPGRSRLAAVFRY